MQAWCFTGTNEPLVLLDIDEPTPGPGEVVIDIRAAGLCHSDVGVMVDAEWMSRIPSTPIVLGHEIAGVIESVGPDVTGFKVGDRVGVCPSAGFSTPGFARHGGFTSKYLGKAGELVRMPDGLSFELAALGTDRVMFSADYPFEDSEGAGRFMDAMPMEEGLRRAVAHDNAARLLGLS